MDGKKYLKECLLEKIYHFDALAKWNDFKVGSPLTLSKSNDEDGKDEVLLELEDCKSKIGCLSKDDGKDILPFLQQGWEDTFSATISFKKDDVDSENKRIKVVIYIKKKENGSEGSAK